MFSCLPSSTRPAFLTKLINFVAPKLSNVDNIVSALVTYKYRIEYYIILGHFKAARMQANQALKTLKPYSFEWRKAQDIIKISSKLGENN